MEVEMVEAREAAASVEVMGGGGEGGGVGGGGAGGGVGGGGGGLTTPLQIRSNHGNEVPNSFDRSPHP
jgi:hypothetical protein